MGNHADSNTCLDSFYMNPSSASSSPNEAEQCTWYLIRLYYTFFTTWTQIHLIQAMNSLWSRPPINKPMWPSKYQDYNVRRLKQGQGFEGFTQSQGQEENRLRPTLHINTPSQPSTLQTYAEGILKYSVVSLSLERETAQCTSCGWCTTDTYYRQVHHITLFKYMYMHYSHKVRDIRLKM